MQPTKLTGGQKLVAIGGGTGLSTLLAGLKRLVGKTEEPIWIESLSAIVTVSDDGGSSGRLREELQMLPPGDIRNCMIALSEDSTLLSRLFKHRFRGEGALVEVVEVLTARHRARDVRVDLVRPRAESRPDPVRRGKVIDAGALAVNEDNYWISDTFGGLTEGTLMTKALAEGTGSAGGFLVHDHDVGFVERLLDD